MSDKPRFTRCPAPWEPGCRPPIDERELDLRVHSRKINDPAFRRACAASAAELDQEASRLHASGVWEPVSEEVPG